VNTQDEVAQAREGAGFDQKPVDPFRARIRREVAERYGDARQEHLRKEREMWLGSLVSRFDAFEIDLLSDLGFLSISDYQMLTKARQAHSAKGEA
jgi:tryptophanase